MKETVQEVINHTISLQGVNVHYEYYGGHSESPTLILVHGFLSSTFSFRQIIPLLKANFRVYAIDLPGFGQSEKSKHFTYSLDNFSNLLLEFIGSQKLQNVTIVGHSMGGQVALFAAKKAPNIISKLILLGCCGYVRRANHFLITCSYAPFFSHFVRKWISRKGVKENLELVIYDKSLVSNELIAGYSKPFQDKHFFESLVRLLRDREGDMDSETLKEIKVPCLLLWGKYDRVMTTSIGVKLHHDLPNSTLKVFDKAGHLLPEEIPEKIYKEIRSFV